ncbi:MAG: protein kinase [Acidobacteriota bacterium]|nr:protein kinase [Blastocatellia bacterium]MDW8413153.1 protein kinase [Acidobacteriota bacterium]
MRDAEKAYYKSLLGSVIDRKYKLVSLIGQGGMAMVFLAERLHLHDMVAVKVLRARGLDTGSSKGAVDEPIGRFRIEAAAAAKVKHPNVVAIYDFGSTDDGIVYIVMELLEGPGLDAEMRRHRRLSIERTLEILKPVCSAIAAAHATGLLHRDIKPSNIILHRSRYDNSEVAKVVDFGIAKFYESPEFVVKTTEGVVLGTAEYMSPEQCQGQPLDGRSDIYSLAVVCYQMLTGSLPYFARTTSEYLVKHVRAVPIPLRDHNSDIPPQVERVVMRALSKNPAMRPATATEFYEELEKAWLESKACRQALETGTKIEQKVSEAGAYVEPRFTAFGGRKAELNRLFDAWRQVYKGEGKLLLILGEPGIGKSSLLDEFCSQVAATASAVVLRGRFYESAGIRSYHGMIIELKGYLRKLRSGSERAEIFGAEAEILMQRLAQIWQTGGLANYTTEIEVRARNFVTLARVFCLISRHKPVLLAVDDIHWADESVYSLLAHLTHTLAAERLLIAVTARNSNTNQAFRDWLSTFGRNSDILELVRLQEPQIKELLESIFGRVAIDEQQVEFLHLVSGGSPFFLIEHLKSLVAERRIVLDSQQWVFGDLNISPPRSLVDYIELVLEKVSQETRQVLTFAAVIGEQFDVELLSYLLQEQEAQDSVRSALRTGLELGFVAQLPEDVYRFSNATVRTVLCESLNKRVRRKLHKAIADYLTRHRAGTALCEQAYHYYEAMQFEQAFTCCVKAAEIARKQSQINDLSRFVRWGEKCIEESDRLKQLENSDGGLADCSVTPDLVARFRWLNALSLLYHGHTVLAEQQLQKALACRSLQPQLCGHVFLTFGLARFGAGLSSDAIDYYRQALQRYRECFDLAGQGWVLHNLCILYEQRGDYTLALDCARAAAQIAVLVDSRLLESFAMSAEAWILARLRRFEEAEIVCKKALAIARNANRAACCACSNALAEIYAQMGNYDQALEHYSEALKLAKALGNTRYEWIVITNLAEIYVARQKFTEAESCYLTALKMLEQTGNRLYEHMVLGRLVRNAIRLDKITQAQAYKAQAEVLVREIDLLKQKCEYSLAVAELFFAEGNNQEVLRETEHGLQLARRLGSVELEWPFLLVRARSLNALGMVAQAREVLKDCVDLIERAAEDIPGEQLRKSYLDHPDRALALSMVVG